MRAHTKLRGAIRICLIDSLDCFVALLFAMTVYGKCTRSHGLADANWCYFFLPEAAAGCHPAPFWLGAAAITLIFSFLGFLVSRLPRC